MEAPDYFVDEQVNGPFKRFRHVHEFSEEPSGTVMVDRVEFEAPFEPLGRLVEKLVLARYLRNLIESRTGSSSWTQLKAQLRTHRCRLIPKARSAPDCGGGSLFPAVRAGPFTSRFVRFALISCVSVSLALVRRI